MSKLKTRKLEVNQNDFTFKAQVRAASFDEEKNTIIVEWTSGASVKRRDWFGNSYNEVLATENDSADLERMNAGAPFLKEHWADISEQIGVVLRAWFEDGKGLAEIQLSRNHKDSQWINNDIKDGILKNVSVGYWPLEYEEIPTGEEEIPTYLVKKYEPCEISLVAVPADAKAQVRSDSEKTKKRSITILTRKEDQMKPEIKPTVETTTQAVDVEAEKRNAINAERERSTKIRAAVKAAGLKEDFAESAVTRGISFEETSKEIFSELEKRQAAQTTNPQVVIESINEVTTRAQTTEAMIGAVMHRAGTSKELTDHARQFRGMNLTRMAEEILISNGAKQSEIRNLSRSRIITRAMATSDFQNLTGGVIRKSLRKGYEVQPPTFWPFVTRGTLPDYKETNRVNFGAATSLDKVAEGQDYTHGTFEDGGEKIQLLKYGKLFKVTEELIINDDLSALSRVPTLLGQAAARKEADLVYGILTGNPLMADGDALFNNTSHKNLAVSSAIDVTNLGLIEKLLMEQKGLKDKDFLNLMVKYLIVGTAKKVQAQQVLGSLVASKSGDVNPFATQGIQLIVDPRVTGNKWFVSADPSTIDTIEVAYLDGEEGVQISEEVDFKSDCLVWKVKHVVAAKAIDHRGMAYNAGA